jgi:extracellular matrix regulatory protein B
MFIHLGEDVVVQAREVIVILDGQVLESSTITSEFLQMQHKDNPVIKISNEMTKSIVITKKHIYFSPLSSSTLKRRSQLHTSVEMLDNGQFT